ncbi:suppressor of fused domain protein [Streptomyces sp. NPDC086777]|uniref:suppressor of fused domain protein n=1 Tax=Streptomyces sp. NPDC086777 TaxID=3154866 RepID=UPI00344D046F
MEKHGRGLEFVMTAHVRDRRFVEPMAMIAYYHCGGHQLDLEHSLPIGEPWVPGSDCDHLLISLPYLHGPDLEHCPLPGGHARILWPLPVTTAEIEFRRRHGPDALEQLLDEAEIVPPIPSGHRSPEVQVSAGRRSRMPPRIARTPSGRIREHETPVAWRAALGRRHGWCPGTVTARATFQDVAVMAGCRRVRAVVPVRP